MSKSEDNEKKPEKPWLPTAKKFGDFVLSVLNIQRSVDALKKQNTQLQDEVRQLQRQVDQQAGQIQRHSFLCSNSRL